MKKIILLILALAMTGFLCNTVSAHNKKSKYSKSNEPVVTKIYSLGDFKGIAIFSFSEVILEYSTENSFSIIADSSLQQYIDLDRTKESLTIKTKSKHSSSFQTQRIIIRTNQITKINLNSVANFRTEGKFSTNQISLEMNAVSATNLNVDCEQLYIKANACSFIKVKGNVYVSNVTCNAISKLSLKELESDIVNIDATSCGQLEVYSRNEMSIKARSVSSINYYGDFKIVREELTAVSSVQKN